MVAPLQRYYMGLGMGPDGMLYGADFEGNGQFGPAGGTFGDIYRINPQSGNETLVSSGNVDLIVHDLAFSPTPRSTPIPSMASWGALLLVLGILTAVGFRMRRETR